MSTNPADVTPEAGHSNVTVAPLSVHIGAEIGGVDLRQPLSGAELADIRAALLKWKVVFFRDQVLDHAQHVAFSRQFGELTPGHVVFGGDDVYPEIYSVAKFRKANTRKDELPRRPWSGWHADITAAINPPFASVLRGVTVPPYGGDTQWTNLAAAYEALSAPVKAFADGLRAVHRYDVPFNSDSTKEYDEIIKSRNMATEHPLVRVHPETGERVLYASPSFLKWIAGVSRSESMQLLEMFWEHAVRPEFTVRFKWEPGSIAFWDNRSTAHLAPRDIFDSDFERQFYRVTIMGDVPVGVDGRPSVALEGEPITGVS